MVQYVVLKTDSKGKHLDKYRNQKPNLEIFLSFLEEYFL